MENNIEVGAKTGPSGISCLAAGAATPDSNGDAFSTALACHSRSNPFKDQLGEFSKDLFNGMVKEFGNEVKKNDQGRSAQASRNGIVPKTDSACIPSHDSEYLHAYDSPINTMALDPKMVEPERGLQALNYVKDSFSASGKLDEGLAKDPLAWAGEKIDQAVHSAESTVDTWRQDMVAFGERHGGVAGKALTGLVVDGLGFVEGADFAAYDMVAGTVSLAYGISKVADPLEWANHPGENVDRLKTAANAAAGLARLSSPMQWMIDPKGNLKSYGALLDGLTHEYQQAARQGDWAKLGGRLAVDIGSFFIGAGEVKAAEKGAEAANAVAHLAEGAGKAAHVAEGTGKAAETAKGLNAVEHATQEAARLGETAETANAAGKTISELDTAAGSVDNLDRAAGEIAGPKTTTKQEESYRGINGPNAGEGYAKEILPGGSGQAVSGHAELRYGSGDFTIPDGTTLVAPRHGIKITDTSGRVLENIDLERFANAGPKARNRLIKQQLDDIGIKNKRMRNRVLQDLKDARVFKSGDSMPDYTIKAPDKLSVHEASTTVESSTPLSKILQPDAGTCSLATCTEVRGL